MLLTYILGLTILQMWKRVFIEMNKVHLLQTNWNYYLPHLLDKAVKIKININEETSLVILWASHLIRKLGRQPKNIAETQDQFGISMLQSHDHFQCSCIVNKIVKCFLDQKLKLPYHLVISLSKVLVLGSIFFWKKHDIFSWRMKLLTYFSSLSYPTFSSIKTFFSLFSEITCGIQGWINVAKFLAKIPNNTQSIICGSGGGGIPLPRGYSTLGTPHQTWPGGYPCQGGYPTSGTPQPIRSGQGGTPPQVPPGIYRLVFMAATVIPYDKESSRSSAQLYCASQGRTWRGGWCDPSVGNLLSEGFSIIHDHIEWSMYAERLYCS